MRHKLSVAIPVFNELRSINTLLLRVAAVRLVADWEMEILVCNDGSTDGTDAAVRRFQWIHPELEFHYLSWPTNCGKGASLQAALGVATGEMLVVQDADLEYDPGSYNLMLDATLKHKADAVYGSRFLRPSFISPWHRRANQWLTRYSNFWTGLALTDVHTCLKMFRTDLLRSLDLQERGFGFCPEVTAKLARVPGVRIIEVPVSYRPRRAAEGKKIGIRDGLRALWCSAKHSHVRCRASVYQGLPSADPPAYSPDAIACSNKLPSGADELHDQPAAFSPERSGFVGCLSTGCRRTRYPEPKAEEGRAHWHRLVRQERFVSLDPGGAGGGGFVV